ncbi:MAG: right-handed parallel beta-helix repeat-containing protein [Candidatus Hydrogenedentota bacterium]
MISSILRAVALCGLVLASAAWGADVYVAPQGDDAWPGALAEPNADETDGPLASLAAAKERVREVLTEEPGEAVVVEIADGFYRLDDTLFFEPADSGTEQAPVIYRAADGAQPVISGGERLTGWSEGDDGRWRVTLDAVAEGEWDFTQLFVDGQRRFRPRLPRDGYFYVERQLDPSPAHEDQGHDRFGYAEGDIPDDLDSDQFEVMAFHIWSASRMRVADWDQDERVFTFTGPTSALTHWAEFQEGRRYFLDNVGEALEEPGEWYLDTDAGELTYIPMPDETPEDVEVIAPRLEQLVVLQGDVDNEDWVRHLRFEGLTFAHTNWTLPEEGYSFPQAEVPLTAAVLTVGARDVSFDSCAVRHTGGYAFEAGPGCRDVAVLRSELLDLAGGGVKIGHGGGPGSWAIGELDSIDLSADEAEAQRITVHDTTIAHGGRMHPAAVGVWIGHTSHNTVTHNDIYDFYYTGVSVGWTWGYHEPSRTHHNQIEHNHIHTIGQHVLSDMGAVYTLGLSPGTTVNNNVMHDIMSYGYGGWGLYPDEGTTDIEMRNNLVYRTRTGGFHQHYGRDNVIENNILAFGEQHQVQRTRTEDHRSFFFRHNIVYWENDSPLLGSNWEDDNFTIDHNLYYNPNQDITFHGGATLDEWRERSHDRESMIADPLFVDPANEDFRLKANSPALEVGFEPFDYSAAGRITAPVFGETLPEAPAGYEGYPSE